MGAGAYFDRSRDGLLVFQFTGDIAARRSEAAILIGAEAPFEVDEAQYSTAELAELQGIVVQAWPELRSRGFDIVGTGIDVRINRLVVGATGRVEELTEVLQDTFGPSVVASNHPRAYPDACTPSNCGSPMKGGLKIKWVPDPDAFCTSGWNMRRGGTRYVLTAGHCLSLTNGVSTSQNWKHSSSTFGHEVESTWASFADADAGIITVSFTSGQAQNRFLAGNPDPDSVRSVTAWKPTAQQVTGITVCRHLVVTLHDCGSIVLTDWTLDVDGNDIKHQWVVEDMIDALPGDSGGPYFLNQTAYGIHSDSGSEASTWSWYTPIGWALSTLSGSDKNLCLDADC